MAPNPSVHPDDEDRFDAGFDAGQTRNSGNAHYANRHRGQEHDLDANAPMLKSADLQRLNRKALVFLAGIVALLAVAAVWMLSSAASGSRPAARAPEEAVVIPELPRDPAAAPATDAGSVAPIAVADSQPQLPPLPVEEADRPSAGIRDDSALPARREPTLMERRMSNMAGSGNDDAPAQPTDPYLQAMLTGVPANQAAMPGADPQLAPTGNSSAQYLNNPDALLLRGTYIRCVLETRIITDIPGFTSCIVTEPIYSVNGRRLLLPKGSKVSGKYQSDANGPRVAVIWDRITTPTGIDVSMASPGVDNLGGAGHPGAYNAHWASRIASALMISLVSDAFKYAAAQNGPETTTVTGGGLAVRSPYQSVTARTMERLANQALDRSANRPATVTINQGTIVNVYVAKDMDFSSVLARP